MSQSSLRTTNSPSLGSVDTATSGRVINGDRDPDSTIYLDHAATTPMRPEAWAAMEPIAGQVFGNPSGSHATSRHAKKALEDSREQIAAILGCHPLEVVFTSGGTEADALALCGSAQAQGKGGVVTVATEHEAVLDTTDYLDRLGHPTTIVGVDRFGRVDPEELSSAVDGQTAVVSVMAVNNETGTLNPIAALVSSVKSANPNCLVHTDAVQAYLTDFNFEASGLDLASFAAHKFGGPKGVGMLLVKEGTKLEPILHGGGQELGRRSGTQNVMGAAGMAAALAATISDRERMLSDIVAARQALEDGLSAVAHRTVPPEHTTPQHCHLTFTNTISETLLVRLDRRGVAASAGSACQSGAVGASHVLLAMGLEPSAAQRCMRFSLGWTTRPEDGQKAAEIITEAAELKLKVG